MGRGCGCGCCDGDNEKPLTDFNCKVKRKRALLLGRVIKRLQTAAQEAGQAVWAVKFDRTTAYDQVCSTGENAHDIWSTYVREKEKRKKR